MRAPTFHRPVLLWAAVLAVLALVACDDTTPVSAGADEGVLVIEVQPPETATGDFQFEWMPSPERFGALTRQEDTYRYLEFPVGTYELTVTQPGAQSETLTVEVIEGEEARYVVELEPVE